jgi:hypothetical protein
LIEGGKEPPYISGKSVPRVTSSQQTISSITWSAAVPVRRPIRSPHSERALENGGLDVLALFQVPVDVLDGDGRVVNENTDRERETAERHEVDRLPEGIEDDDGRDDGQRYRDGDDSCSPESARRTSGKSTQEYS